MATTSSDYKPRAATSSLEFWRPELCPATPSPDQGDGDLHGESSTTDRGAAGSRFRAHSSFSDQLGLRHHTPRQNARFLQTIRNGLPTSTTNPLLAFAGSPAAPNRFLFALVGLLLLALFFPAGSSSAPAKQRPPPAISLPSPAMKREHDSGEFDVLPEMINEMEKFLENHLTVIERLLLYHAFKDVQARGRSNLPESCSPSAHIAWQSNRVNFLPFQHIFPGLVSSILSAALSRYCKINSWREKGVRSPGEGAAWLEQRTSLRGRERAKGKPVGTRRNLSGAVGEPARERSGGNRRVGEA
ncbi:CONSTANS-like 9 [Striga asiatica]|uniref:CONSTANS-like 9 n=1 Tax=Striga asiatica TaxID=4170 RepID=A0A5A7NVT9_STRAF|nr:CONSTANS-like 9 [Striga asiatica]